MEGLKSLKGLRGLKEGLQYLRANVSRQCWPPAGSTKRPSRYVSSSAPVRWWRPMSLSTQRKRCPCCIGSARRNTRTSSWGYRWVASGHRNCGDTGRFASIPISIPQPAYTHEWVRTLGSPLGATEPLFSPSHLPSARAMLLWNRGSLKALRTRRGR